MACIRAVFDYDHEQGCLRWRPLDDNYVYFSKSGKVISNVSTMSRVKAGDIAGAPKMAEYRVTHLGVKKCGLRLIWQHVTGELTLCKIRTISPRETRFSIGNLYVEPLRLCPRGNARNRVVVSYSYEMRKYTVVDVDRDYNKQVMSYHDTIEEAEEALKNPQVSFL